MRLFWVLLLAFPLAGQRVPDEYIVELTGAPAIVGAKAQARRAISEISAEQRRVRSLLSDGAACPEGSLQQNDAVTESTLPLRGSRARGARCHGKTTRATVARRPRPNHQKTGAGYCALFAVRLSITASMLKLPGFWRGGNSLKLCSHCPT